MIGFVIVLSTIHLPFNFSHDPLSFLAHPQRIRRLALRLRPHHNHRPIDQRLSRGPPRD